RDMGFIPFVTGLCVVCYVLTLAASGNQIGGLLSPSNCSSLRFGASGWIPVYGLDRWWTLLSASWLHGGILHIFFNMYWIRYLAPDVAELYGAGRMIIIYVVAGITGFLVTSTVGYYLPFLPGPLAGAPITLGASAAIFGLLGALVYYGRRGGSSHIGAQAKQLAVIVFIFGFIMSGVDNYAHAGGFAGGWLVSRWLDPLKPERIDHLVIAVVLLALSVGSIVLSLLVPVGLPQLNCL
ncbi:MAG: rhomboid family intramembrane serine protease, partial [Vicinamibacterales bacterium]